MWFNVDCDFRALSLFELCVSYSAGNEAVCGAAEYLDAVVRDDRVTTVLMSLETIRNPEKFRRRRGKQHDEVSE